ncbi:PREDICTED: probable inactive receptor-like protein kinase At3g56050 [Populus euphratica]|uniref:Probable inactive receptor-like protein kinase At3g56050 n=1 Tax=Populus euphratica TaxID=75702 RepID=A0AAJ6T3Q6_POPEU|nr:PREDICTED: probable inactive receptor-like protein kinase At3g56050 [Populus euphratica]XP_011003699.1 PREDICTED: probable inactive receptor-like protein kinase At3g56050 [Populus euphratica]
MTGGWWRLNRVKLRMEVLMLVLLLFHQSFSFCWSLNTEGLALLRFRERVERDPFGVLSNWNEKDGDIDPCSWFGVECSDGKVVILHLTNLCLGGTLTPQLGRLAYLKSINLRNNSFYGNIPREIGELKELEALDLGYNNFSGPFPSNFANNLSLTTLLLDNNKFLDSVSPELNELMVLSEVQAVENQLRASCCCRDFTWNIVHSGNTVHRMLLQVAAAPNPPIANNRHKAHQSGSEASPSPSLFPQGSQLSPSLAPSDSPFLSPSPSFSPSPSPSESPSFSPAEYSSTFPFPPSPSPMIAPTPASPAPENPPSVFIVPPQRDWMSMVPAPSPNHLGQSKSKHHTALIAGVIAGSMFALISASGIFFFRSSKVVTVRPWATGLSGQLQNAFVTGVPKLKRSELEAACEDFSNIIGSFSNGTAYKGTLSSGVEIAVMSTAVRSHEDWLKNLEAQFRKKIDTLSKMNHKNFVNLIGFCEENEPFTRMMVFEYAPNGTLFEHLHIKEAEHLDWGMRLRIAMGMAYCLEYMHQLTPPIAHKNLQSSTIYLTEDYAAKISDFSFGNDATAAKIGSASMELLESQSSDPEGNIYSFGVILFEMITGRIPYAVDNGSLADWASDYLRGERSLREIVDPTLKSFQENELEKLSEVIRNCIHPDAKQRPTMKEIAAKLKEITAMEPDGATPKLSPLWWAELEIMSTEGS